MFYIEKNNGIINQSLANLNIVNFIFLLNN